MADSPVPRDGGRLAAADTDVPPAVIAAARRLTALDAFLDDAGDAKDLEIVLGFVLGADPTRPGVTR